MNLGKDNKLALFEGQKIRKVFHDDDWWFSVEDVVLALIESLDPKQYTQRMKQRDPELGKGWVQIVRTLHISTSGGPQKLNCANTGQLNRELSGKNGRLKSNRADDRQCYSDLCKALKGGGLKAETYPAKYPDIVSGCRETIPALYPAIVAGFQVPTPESRHQSRHDVEIIP
jgi:hypothetical protein